MSFLDAIASRLPAERIDADPARGALFSEDVAGPAAFPAATILRPRDSGDVAAIAAAARETATPLIPRGGGMSYTGGYAPPGPGAALLDLRELDGIEIDAAARTARAGAGATWEKLHAAAAEAGLRAPFFGPLSGISATIGGALSQNGAFFGSAAHGYAADTAIALEVVDGRGRRLRLGPEAAGRPGLPWFGPGLMQALLGDAGALGIKTEATLRLLPLAPETGFASFAFATADAVLAAQAALRDVPHLSEVWAFDAEAHRGLARAGFTVLETARMAGDVAGAAGSVFSAARRLAEAAVMRRAVLADLAWSLHLTIEPPLAGLLEPVAAAAAEVCVAAGGRALPDTIPRVTRSRPFRPIKALVGPDGERWLPCHGVFPAPAAINAVRALAEWRATREDEMARHGVRLSMLLASVGAEIIVEPQLAWPDALSDFQRAFASPSQVKAHSAAPARPEARALAHDLRGEMTELLAALGGGHLQIGRHYRYLPDLDPAAADLLRAMKRELDPAGILNPGALGL